METIRGYLPQGLPDTTANIPGYGLISKLALKAFGVDIGDIVTIYLLLFGIYQGARFVYYRARIYFIDFATSVVQIDQDEALYYQIIAWMSAQRKTKHSRDLKASSSRPIGQDSDDDDIEYNETELVDDTGLFNYEKWAGRTPVFYDTNFCEVSFLHGGNYFIFTKEERENKFSHVKWERYIALRCLGRSTQPIKDLVKHVKDWSSKRDSDTTTIFRSAVDRSRGAEWSRQATRPSRPMDTVSLDEAQKKQIMFDINDYLSPKTACWYATRGIPHRRGYLFHGPPGTGKTSLSFALAGIFGLNIYCASLSEPELKESDLAALFRSLPQRCIVLLEDIDSAGIRRDGSSDNMEVHRNFDSHTDEDADEDDGEGTIQKKGPVRGLWTWGFGAQQATVQNIEKKAKSSSVTSEENVGKSNITLSGLLNIIDGAASHEGRVLIMTTNYPEKLDSALIRPGRVDLQIRFTLATHDQIRAIFKRMYSTEHDAKRKNTETQATNESSTCSCNHNATPNSSAKTVEELSPERLTELAEQFTAQLPDTTLSPAEIQGYLLMKKTDPIGAIVGVKEWKNKLLEARKKGMKVIDSV
ncbi:P-loop containing nucleoside triphosphate hydrolase protein [Ampelomyces quisqualis]|uniref:P-loop containing nucleoside triphosphate hydrolase protein n=1 Tax=Ampelomyces quisqualis TaxID=50730 RepID=A0A6A5QW68_AMPQU|nr:P-loop containing nucleoside triphosphate hydrolase protein [Ampelomyces quisqualis]